MDKQRILELAKTWFQCFRFCCCKSWRNTKNLQYPIITKDISPNSGNWKFDVFICENEEELKEAYKTIQSYNSVTKIYKQKE